MRRLILTIAALCALVGVGVAQQLSPSPAFEVATIRPSGTSLGGGDSGGVQPSGRFAATNTILYDLIRVVFGLQQHEIVAGERLPSWVRTERWDIIGKGPPVTDEEAQRPLYFRMMQNLLIERFKLVTRREERDTPVYALVVARDDRRLGPQLRSSSADCPALLAAFKATGARQSPLSPVCGLRNERNRLWGTGVPLTEMTRILSLRAGRPVVDGTGLTGSFDLDVKFTPDDAADPTSGASLFTALQEQLGLRLDSRRAPVNVIVIESAERPTPD